ncbi:uncharacterized protein METZ01_LOCUS12890 [marine metagenome]|uniref:Uncharacterized protein n=1 Tax=marine metagenome TaxID=408172 RepID=A0A381NZG0_9ZZZZ
MTFVTALMLAACLDRLEISLAKIIKCISELDISAAHETHF